MPARVPVVCRLGEDGIAATAELDWTPRGGWDLHDFRDREGRGLSLPSGVRLEVNLRDVQEALPRD